MPSDRARQEVDGFVEDLQRALSLVSPHPQLLTRPAGTSLTIEPPNGQAVEIGNNLWLGLWYYLTRHGERYSTRRYRITVQRIAENRGMRKATEWLVRWELHGLPEYPHVHVNGGTPTGWELPQKRSLNDLHIPTSRSLLEDAVEFLIEEFGALREDDVDWRRVLRENRGRFGERQSWLMRPEV